METVLLLPGREDETAKSDAGLERFLKVDVKTARTVDGVSRSAGTVAFAPPAKDVDDDDIIEMEFENNGRRWKQWTTVGQLRSDFAKSGEVSISRDGKQELRIPFNWEANDKTRFGVTEIALKGLKVFGIDLDIQGQIIDKVAQPAARKAAAAVAAHFESQTEKPFGLYRFDNLPNTGELITDAKKLSGGEPYLLFIHGTASSSMGSFGKLAGQKEWEELRAHYGNRILALEHRTFSVSPIQNALDIAELLPDNARLHVVTHSRGGLVGELLCLAEAGAGLQKFDALTKVFTGEKDKEIAAEREKQRQQLKQLWEMLVKKQARVERFVRVACPARGTTLAAKRMDMLASAVINAIGFIPGVKQNPVAEIGYDLAKATLLALVKTKADPRHLPGIEAMVPTSPLVEFLNHPELATKSYLAVIAGDIEVGSLKLTIPALVGNSFFWAQNDLVVNTKSMAEGIRREQKAFRFFDQGSDVSHFNYFFNETSRRAMRQWLMREDGSLIGDFKEVSREARVSRDGRIDQWLEEEARPADQFDQYELKITVSHGDLRNAKYPVAVGHYDGDGIISAEKIIDRLLGNRLTKRFGMRLYPGPLGTAEVVLGPAGSAPAGALVIGLGEMGGITPEVVRNGVTIAALRYANLVAEDSGGERKKGRRSAAFSSLLIGTYGGNALKIKDSVNVIVQGAMQANRILQEQGLWDRVRIDAVEIVELYEDCAIQAIRAAHDLRKNPPLDFAERVEITVEPNDMLSVGGGRYQRPTSEYDTYWWGRIQITGTKSEAVKPAKSPFAELPALFSLDPDLQVTQRHFLDRLIEDAVHSPKKRAQLSDALARLLMQDRRQEEEGDCGLEFLLLTERARAEASLQGTQRRLVDWMVANAVNDTRYDPKLSTSLFELLIPNSLKGHTEDVVLLLDRESAQYPWELLTERSQINKPLATRMGILRQFRTDDFRPNPQPSRGMNALVVGDTANSGLVKLEGAKDEAQRVAEHLRGGGYSVSELIEKDGQTIVNELFAREYQVLHIAAHGGFDAADPNRSGVVLDDGRFLTSKELTNLRTVPDLVFINCCHLGKMERRLNNQQPHRLAASISEELIRMGVKAVVAAGWAVDDAAATIFAGAFYREMLSGEAFGKAVLKARERTFDLSGRTNTWGAYQCYGNPNFRLKQWSKESGREARFFSRREYRDELKSIVERAGVDHGAVNQALNEQLKKMLADVPDNFKDGEVLADFADAWRALGDFKRAIDLYTQAIDKVDARAAINSIEKLGNLECRYAVQLWKKNNAATPKRASKAGGGAKARSEDYNTYLERARNRFDWLLNLQETSERYSLVGKAYKNLALVSADKASCIANLKLAVKNYSDGFELSKRKKEPREKVILPGFNFVACSLLLPGYKKEKLLAIVNYFDEITEKNGEAEKTFWTRIAQPEIELLRHLVKGDLAKAQSRLVREYKTAFAAGAKPSEIESVLQQMDLLAHMLGAADRTVKEKGLSAALNAIREDLIKITQSL